MFRLVCGKLSKGRKIFADGDDTKIVGGEEAKINEIPWQVVLSRSNTQNGQFCGGKDSLTHKIVGAILA